MYPLYQLQLANELNRGRHARAEQQRPARQLLAFRRPSRRAEQRTRQALRLALRLRAKLPLPENR